MTLESLSYCLVQGKKDISVTLKRSCPGKERYKSHYHMVFAIECVHFKLFVLQFFLRKPLNYLCFLKKMTFNVTTYKDKT